MREALVLNSEVSAGNSGDDHDEGGDGDDDDNDDGDKVSAPRRQQSSQEMVTQFQDSQLLKTHELCAENFAIWLMNLL